MKQNRNADLLRHLSGICRGLSNDVSRAWLSMICDVNYVVAGVHKKWECAQFVEIDDFGFAHNVNDVLIDCQRTRLIILDCVVLFNVLRKLKSDIVNLNDNVKPKK